ncbi:hypothetical protein V7O62_06410 [Methanolobus sp. ZRKC2]
MQTYPALSPLKARNITFVSVCFFMKCTDQEFHEDPLFFLGEVNRIYL